MKKLITLLTAILTISCSITACTSAPTTETQGGNNWNQNAYGNYNNVYAGSDVSSAPSYNGNQNYSNNGGYQNSNSDVDVSTASPKPSPTEKRTETETQVGACNHSYSYSSANCSKCGELHPNVAATSLEIPTLPLVINEYDYNNELKSSVKVTKIEVDIGRRGDNDGADITISVKFSGTKTYDKNGSGQSSSVKIGWKLYDADGNVEETGTFYAPQLAMGESFANKSENLISYSAAGKYRLEILNVN